MKEEIVRSIIITSASETLSAISGYYGVISKNNLHNNFVKTGNALMHESYSSAAGILSGAAQEIMAEGRKIANVSTVPSDILQNIKDRSYNAIFNEPCIILPYALIYGILDGIYSKINELPRENIEVNNNLFNEVKSLLCSIDPSIETSISWLNNFRKKINIDTETFYKIFSEHYSYLSKQEKLSLNEQTAAMLSVPPNFSSSGTIASKEIAGRGNIGRFFISLDKYCKIAAYSTTSFIINTGFVSGKNIGQSLIAPIILSVIKPLASKKFIENRLTDAAALLYAMERYSFMTKVPFFVANLACSAMSGFVSGITNGKIEQTEDNNLLNSVESSMKYTKDTHHLRMHQYNSGKKGPENVIQEGYYGKFQISEAVAQKLGVFENKTIISKFLTDITKIDDVFVAARRYLLPSINKSSKQLGLNLLGKLMDGMESLLTEIFVLENQSEVFHGITKNSHNDSRVIKETEEILHNKDYIPTNIERNTRSHEREL